jgi:hypothetical protein
MINETMNLQILLAPVEAVYNGKKPGCVYHIAMAVTTSFSGGEGRGRYLP